MHRSSPPIRVGWIGTGVMGEPMCAHLLAADYPVTVFNRTRSRAEELLRRGAAWAGSPAEVAAASDVTFTMVGTPADVREVILGSAGVLSQAKRGSLVVDMTTSEPSLAKEIHRAARAIEVGAVDAPVSGGDIGARDASLSIMVGAEEQDFARVEPLLRLLGRTVVRQGGPGAGQHAKVANQILVASNIVGACEALLYGYRAGLDLSTLLMSVSQGAAGSWSLSNYGPRILAGDLRPGFAVRHFLKDLGIALTEAKRMSLALPGLALAEQLYLALQAQRGSELGIQGLVLALARACDIDWPPDT